MPIRIICLYETALEFTFFNLWHKLFWINDCFQFLSQRGIGSTPSVTALVKAQVSEVQSECNTWHEESSSINLRSFCSLQSVNSRITLKSGNVILQNEINHSNQYPLTFRTQISPMISEFEKHMILLSDSGKGPDTEPPKNDGGRPSPEQLQLVQEVLTSSVSILKLCYINYLC